MQELLNKIWAQTAKLLFVLVAILPLGCADSLSTPNPQADEVVLFGTVEDCWIGKSVFPVRRIEVHAYGEDKAKPILQIFEQMSHLPDANVDPGAVTKFSELYLKLIDLTKAMRDEAVSTKTNEHGEYVLKGLPKGKKYLVLVIAPEKEDAVSYFTDASTEILSPGKHELNFWMSPTSKQSCRATDTE